MSDNRSANNLIQLRGKLEGRKNPSQGGGVALMENEQVTSRDIERVLSSLHQAQNYWNEQAGVLGDDALIEANYKRVVPKSKRIAKIFSIGSHHCNEYIVGARFAKTTPDQPKKHIITYFVDKKQITEAIVRLEQCQELLNKYFGGRIDNEAIRPKPKDDMARKNKEANMKAFLNEPLSFSSFCSLIVDVSSIEKFNVISECTIPEGKRLVSFYDTKRDIREILGNIGIDNFDPVPIDNSTISLRDVRDLAKITREAPYLIAMAVSDVSKFDIENVKNERPMDNWPTAEKPTDEPTIGVIDTGFDVRSYYKDWVEYHDCVDPAIPKGEDFTTHGTAVSSIIVDGPMINPSLEDNCGKFQVRHFAVATSGANSSATIMRQIRKIVEDNPDIKVWNLSLGSIEEVSENFMSPQGAMLDELQNKHDVIFVVAGTNKVTNGREEERVGSPADSLNSIVVNATNELGRPASYSRRGRVLGFFSKPDICCFGGDERKKMQICQYLSVGNMAGTSFAAPWIARKVAFLIHKMNLSREIAKALIIDSAIGWENINEKDAVYMGFGAVPVRIEDVLSVKSDEIKFYIEGTSNSYDTYSYNLPIPMEKGSYPYTARATLCYFPKGTRSQGVDYTDTELDLYFGRVNDKGSIVSINRNNQSVEDPGYVKEEKARNEFRKWDNVKHIKSKPSDKPRPLKAYSRDMWALSIKSKSRRATSQHEDIQFGLVVTLKEINGRNRYDEFKRMCVMAGWITNEIDINALLNLYSLAEEDVILE